MSESSRPPSNLLNSIKQGEARSTLKHVSDTEDHTHKGRAFLLESIEGGKAQQHLKHAETKEPKLPSKEDIEHERQASQ